MLPARITLILAPLALSAACTPNYAVNDKVGSVGNGLQPGDEEGEEDPGDEEEEEDTSMYDGATLQILSPASGEFIPLGEEAELEALILDAEGNELDWTEVSWTSTVAEDWSGSGIELTTDDLPVGLQSLRAEATLPNGARISDAVGGVLVQHEDAGVYVGNMILDATAEYEGTPITASCVGAAFITIDAYGEVGTGDSTCVLALLGFEQEASHVFDFEVDDGEIEGAASLDLGFTALDFDVAGSIEDGVLEAAWSDSLLGLADLEGTLALERVTRDISGE